MATTEELLKGIIESKKAIIAALRTKVSIEISDNTPLAEIANIINLIKTDVTE